MAHEYRRTGPDEFADQRLPDLPNAGYQTRREKELSDAVMYFLRDAERDRLYLLSLVCDGIDKFRASFMQAFKYLRVDKELTESVFGYLAILAGENPALQRDALLRMSHTSRYRKLATPRSEAEIRDRILRAERANRRH